MAIVPCWFKRTELFGRLLRIWFHMESVSASSQESLSDGLYSSLIRSGDLVFDIGANYGNRIRRFLRLGATVVAVEPQRDCQIALRRWFGENPNVRLVKRAVGDMPGHVELFISNFPTLSSCSPEWISSTQRTGRFGQSHWSKSETVAVTTLDRLIKEHGVPAFMKIDVEGFELAAIRGLTQPVRALSLECASESVPQILSCIDHLEKLGQIEGNFSWGETGTWAFSTWVDAAELRTYLNSSVLPSKDFGDVYIRFFHERR